ncbi:hypothetical protein [Hymenobacter sp. GOD-10R]|uniref:hypothetical protein n=1 Tax=Hymenobacter sp. GOD-10R TaxID=3093922 RepID=UPI002D79B0E1|nr:hypothetical protein [Hymenobacter sp. GOD-10R]WRQ30105.1 hypothetical protein SD425_07505 [Hymenobacter sp. GOD-10R]
MSESITISTAPPEWKASDWEALREAGLAYIEQYAHTLWTDYNRHDPGITTLELLCYAITDLSQRTALDIKDLLTSSYGSAAQMQASFPTVAQVLPTCPVSELDYRKLFIDLEGVRNAWLAKAAPAQTIYVNAKEADPHKRLSRTPVPGSSLSFDLNGLYDLKIDLDPYFIAEEVEAGHAADEAAARKAVLEKVRGTYVAHRDLCEDYALIAEVPVQKIMFCADVDLAPDANVSEVYAQILLVVNQYLAPPIKRYSLAEMQAKTDADGNPLTIDQIFEGPLLETGFILDSELEASELRRVVYTSDLINLIMGIEGVEGLRKVQLNELIEEAGKPCTDWKTKDSTGHRWCLPIREGYQPQLCAERVALAFYKDIIPVGSLADKKKALLRLAELEKAAYQANQKQVNDLPVPTGAVYALNEYRSVANDFPQNYGIGPYGLPDSASGERHSQAKQLKGYLLFFDQLLTNYLAQLANLKNFFGTDASALQTYFGQVVSARDMVGVDELYVNYADLPDTLDDVLAEQEGYRENPERKNRFLDHLLARFAENFNEYALLMHSLYGERSDQEIAHDKAALLQDYPNFCNARAYNYCEPAWETDNVAGTTRRIARLAGMRNFQAHGAAALIVLEAVPDTNDTTQFRFQLHAPAAGMPSKVYLISEQLFATKALAEKVMRKVFNPVPRREQFLVEGGSVWPNNYLLRDLEGNIIAQCPRVFVDAEEAWDDIDEALDALVYGGEALFLVEHLLLRPDPLNPAEGWMSVCAEPDGTFCEPLDPYSFRVSVVLPGYTTRFRNVDYRRYLEKIIRLELPAHVLARICWVSREHLAEFEQKLQQWLTQKAAACGTKDNTAYALALKELILILEKLHTIYPPGVLHNCDNADEENPIVLGRSTLGSVEKEK